VLAAALMPCTLEAQVHGKPDSTLLPGGACPASAGVVAVRVLDRETGAPISRATVVATRTRSGARLAESGWMGTPGDYLIATDAGLPGLTAEGEQLRVVVTLGSRRVEATYLVALSADGCRIELRGGPRILRL
jgi:hypothetical protein